MVKKPDKLSKVVPSDDVLLQALGSQEKVDEYKRFADKEEHRRYRRRIEIQTNELLEGSLQEEYEETIEAMNLVYRKAWGLACEALGLEESEFPSKY